MKASYLGVACGEPNRYGIVFRDFPGCVSAAETLDELLISGAEALAGHVEAMQQDGWLIPPPTDHTVADVLAWLNETDDPSNEIWFGPFTITVDIGSPIQHASSATGLISPVPKSDPDSASFREFMTNLKRIGPVLHMRSAEISKPEVQYRAVFWTVSQELHP